MVLQAGQVEQEDINNYEVLIKQYFIHTESFIQRTTYAMKQTSIIQLFYVYT